MQAFDELLLLKRGGRTIYCGPTGHESQQLVHYFESYKGVDPIPAGTNPASWMLEVSLPQSLGTQPPDSGPSRMRSPAGIASLEIYAALMA